jgi:hypothetical protein
MWSRGYERRGNVLQSNPKVKLIFADLPAVPYFAKGERAAALDLHYDTSRQVHGDEKAKTIPGNINDVHRPTVWQ